MGLRWGLRVCISNKIAGDTDATVQTTLTANAGAWQTAFSHHFVKNGHQQLCVRSDVAHWQICSSLDHDRWPQQAIVLGQDCVLQKTDKNLTVVPMWCHGLYWNVAQISLCLFFFLLTFLVRPQGKQVLVTPWKGKRKGRWWVLMSCLGSLQMNRRDHVWSGESQIQIDKRFNFKFIQSFLYIEIREESPVQVSES